MLNPSSTPLSQPPKRPSFIDNNGLFKHTTANEATRQTPSAKSELTLVVPLQTSDLHHQRPDNNR